MARQAEVRPALIELRKDHRHAAAHRIAGAVGAEVRQVEPLIAAGRDPADDMTTLQQHGSAIAVGSTQVDGRLALECIAGIHLLGSLAWDAGIAR
jgi:hypothetical protein